MSSVLPNAALLPPGAITPVTAPPSTGPRSGAASQAGPSFADVLADRTAAAGAPKFSKHALDRLAQRGIDVNRRRRSVA